MTKPNSGIRQSMELSDAQIGGVVFAAVLLLICFFIENRRKFKRRVAHHQGWTENDIEPSRFGQILYSKASRDVGNLELRRSTLVGNKTQSNRKMKLVLSETITI